MIRFVHPDGRLMTMADIEKAAIEFYLWHFAGSVTKSSKVLRMGRSTFYRKLDIYGLRHLITSDYSRGETHAGLVDKGNAQST